MSFQVRYFRDGLPASPYVGTAQTMFEARRLAISPQINFSYDLAVIEAPDTHDNLHTIEILRSGSQDKYRD
jgi:hypothetical protein